MRKWKLTSHSELAREKMWARINLIPLLQAEEDRDQVRRYWADQAREKELLGDNAKVYHTDRSVSSFPVIFGVTAILTGLGSCGRLSRLLLTPPSKGAERSEKEWDIVYICIRLRFAELQLKACNIKIT